MNTATPTLSNRDRAVLRAVASGRCAILRRPWTTHWLSTACASATSSSVRACSRRGSSQPDRFPDRPDSQQLVRPYFEAESTS